ncbi:MAG: phosphoribosylformylglycinamidine synthase [Alphaproteobacteria bacterium]|jgi:phosphoribosylformylglycinamidine synthase II
MTAPINDNNNTPITDALIAQHGLKPDEYQQILNLIERSPTLTELGIFSAMWNEHCSYKSSKVWLKTLPTTGNRVVYGPGENAGVVDIDDGDVVVFKMESHNHPSFIEPFQGAATGVGGILRDVFTMGARPIAALNAIRFGDPSHPKTSYLFNNVIAGIAAYGNAFGVPNVGGELEFHKRYNHNNLVNAMAVGVAKKDKIFTSGATGIGNPVVYLGAKTGRDGIHGATMASAEFDDTIEEKRPTVQVGDPFTEKLLLEACLELMATDSIIAIQDMGAAGLTCSAVEMGAKGNLGIKLKLDAVPVRESAMTAYEIMLSESQERMLMVLRPSYEDVAYKIFEKWGLDFAIIGETTDDCRFIVEKDGEVKANLPIKELGDMAPEYNRPYEIVKKGKAIDSMAIKPIMSNLNALKKLLSSFNGCSRKRVWENYDHLVRGNTLQIPGGDAAIVRLDSNSTKALAMCCDVNPRYCEADPILGGMQAVVETWRNLISVGSEPLAITDNMNFGNPEKPEIMGQFAGCIQGISQACKALDYPVVSGNVSLYNETDGQGILPTPAIGGIGLIKNIAHIASIALKRENDILFVVGDTKGHLGCSDYMLEIHNSEEGLPPEINLEIEKKNGLFIQSMIQQDILDTVHDISSGGLLVAVAEMAMAGDMGAHIAFAYQPALLFGEDQSRYVIAVNADYVDKLTKSAHEHNIPLHTLGKTGGDVLELAGDFKTPISDLKTGHEKTLYAL